MSDVCMVSLVFACHFTYTWMDRLTFSSLRHDANSNQNQNTNETYQTRCSYFKQCVHNRYNGYGFSLFGKERRTKEGGRTKAKTRPRNDEHVKTQMVRRVICSLDSIVAQCLFCSGSSFLSLVFFAFSSFISCLLDPSISVTFEVSMKMQNRVIVGLLDLVAKRRRII